MGSKDKAALLVDDVATEIALVRQGTNDKAHMWRKAERQMPLVKKFLTLLAHVWPNSGSKKARAERRIARLQVLGFIVRRPIGSSMDLTLGEVSAITSWMEDPDTKEVRPDVRRAMLALQEAGVRDYVSGHV
jgi:hypothetical protein